MPKLVDHARRRADIIAVTWKLIAQRGMDATTMREIARELGMANGALVHYFPDKNAIVRAAFEYVFEATNERVRARIGDATGLAALRVFCQEVMPVEELTLLEARVVIPFWQRALTDADLQAAFVATTAEWRRQILGHLARARADGEVRTDAPDDVVTEQLLAILNGLQILATLTPRATDARGQHAMIEQFLADLA